MSSFGLTNAGFSPMRQADCIQDLQQGFVGTFGQNVNLDDSSVFGQIIGIMAERHALLWEALQDTYNSQYPSGAEGVSVDNLLSIIGLQKLAASATKTNPSPLTQGNGVVLNGLVVYGTPGTVIPQGAIVQTSATPPAQFTIDQAITIGAAVNAMQQLLLSNVPTQGAYSLTFGMPSGATATTYSIPYNAQAQKTLITFGGTPTQGIYVLTINGAPTTALAYNATSDVIQAAIRALGYSGAAVTGLQSTGFTISWPMGTQPFVASNCTTLQFGGQPTSGSFTMVYNGVSSAPIPFSASTAQMQAIIIALTGASNLVLSGAIGTGVAFAWCQPNAPTLTVGANSLGVSLYYSNTLTLNSTVNVTNGVQAYVNQLIDPSTGLQPLTDVAVNSISGGYSINFGANPVVTGQPSSAAQAEPIVTVAANTMQSGNALTNLAVINAQAGQPALGLGSATCTVQGPTIVAAGALNTIGTPIAGWAGVTNQLDCVAGSNVETDTQALARRSTLLSSRANGPLDAIVQQVRQVTGVSAALGFANLRAQSQQIVAFSTLPTSGSFVMALAGELTPAISYSASAAQIQAAIQTLPDFINTTVTGTTAYGFTIDFGGAMGGQAIPLIAIVQNSTGVSITPRFGRPGKAIEIVVQGGKDFDVATAIYDALPAGIAAYGAPIAQTVGSYTAGSATMAVGTSANMAVGQAVNAQGITAGTVIGSIAGSSITLSQPALSTYTNAPVYTTTTIGVLDANGNPQFISFTRPQPVPIYVQISLLTDYFNIPGQPSSGVNPYAKFSPAACSTIQSNIINIINNVPIGGTVVALGTSGLVGAFNGVSGISNYNLAFGPSPNPINTANVQLQPQQVASAQTFNVAISYS